MATIKYLKGDATSPQAKGEKIICHICNDLGGWGKGFVLAISMRWPEPEKDYRDWHRPRAQTDFALGKARFVNVGNYMAIANMVAQRGMKTGSNGPPIRYDAVKQSLAAVSKEALARNASVHMPRIGCGLAGGKWEKIEPIIESELIAKGVAVYVYDF
jgi:O-acetyl-ADP-ribose deacetylase (regulator of RNase III)